MNAPVEQINVFTQFFSALTDFILDVGWVMYLVAASPFLLWKFFDTLGKRRKPPS